MDRNYTVRWYNTIDSTNSEAARTLSDTDNLTVLAAHCQSAGRGQRGNRWTSTPGENLTFSVVLKFGVSPLPRIRAEDQFRVSQAAAVATVQYLASLGINARIKWPNDIYCGDCKICGILIENSVRDGMLTSSIVGIGLNLNQTSFPPDIPNPTSVILEKGNGAVHLDPETELLRFLTALDPLLEQVTSPSCDQLETRYLSLLYRKDEPHRFTDTLTGEEFTATIRGISPQARLILETPEGHLKHYAFKEISYVIRPH